MYNVCFSFLKIFIYQIKNSTFQSLYYESPIEIYQFVFWIYWDDQMISPLIN